MAILGVGMSGREIDPHAHGSGHPRFSLHAAVRVESNDPKRLEQLCRHITRPRWCRKGRPHRGKRPPRPPPSSSGW
jgi:hypothetical protein